MMIRGRKLPLAVAAVSVPLLGLASTVFACTNFVGDFWVWGNSSGYDTTGTLAVQTIGGQPAGGNQAMTQTVNTTVATADDPDVAGTNCTNGSTNYNGCFKIFTQPTQDSNAWALNAGTYDVNINHVGYTNHTTWASPSGDCMTGESGITKVGDVTIGSGTSKGMITAAHDASGNALTVSTSPAGIAGQFAVPNTYTATSGSAEGGVCISDSTATDGTQAPLTYL